MSIHRTFQIKVCFLCPEDTLKVIQNKPQNDQEIVVRTDAESRNHLEETSTQVEAYMG